MLTRDGHHGAADAFDANSKTDVCRREDAEVTVRVLASLAPAGLRHTEGCEVIALTG
jgi:hypothetical protein